MINLLGHFLTDDARGVLHSCSRNAEKLVKIAAKLRAHNPREFSRILDS